MIKMLQDGVLGSFLKALNDLPASTFIRESIWIYPIDQVIHLLCLTVLGGALLIVDLRLLGLGVTSRPLRQVAEDAWPWQKGALIGMFLTGVPQLMSNAVKELFSDYFWMKMIALVIALIFTFTIRRKMTLGAGDEEPGFAGKIVALVSILLWGFVAVNGRLIGLLS
jgi:hypothetical protein